MVTKEEMITVHLKQRDISDPKVLKAMEDVDRNIFVPEHLKNLAYEDSALPIGRSQTISQPYIVAYMAQALNLSANDKVLEIGTGCGYNAAVLSQLAGEIYSLEIIQWLADLAHKNIQLTGIKNIHLRNSNGFEGWPEKAPFDAIILTASPITIPKTLKYQLKIGGKLVGPVGITEQKLVRIERVAQDEFNEETLLEVSFVPMTGEAQNS